MKKICLPAIIIIFFIFINTLTAKTMAILVYPFQNTSEPEYSWISAGITDTVISDLNRIKDIIVISEVDKKSDPGDRAEPDRIIE